MCIYLKTEIDEEQLELSENNKNILSTIITETLDTIENDDEINWEDKLRDFNKSCEELYY
jgi:predicted RNA-binding protein with PUA domain